MAIWIPDLSGRQGPKYLQIVEAMVEDIAAGRLPLGARLPPQRELAYRLGFNPLAYALQAGKHQQLAAAA